MIATLDRTANGVFVVTAVEAATGERRDLWFGQSLRLAVRKQNTDLPEKFRSIYRDYAIEERAGS